MQTYFGLVDSRPETGCSLCSLLKSCVNSKFSIFIAFLSSPLLSFQGCHQALKMNLQQKQTNFAQLSGKSRTMLAKVIAFVIAGQFSRGKEIRKQKYYYVIYVT